MSNSPPRRKTASNAPIGSPRVLVDEKRQAGGEVSEHRTGFTSVQRWLDMTPKTEGETVTSLGLPFPCDAVREIVASERVIYNLRMTPVSYTHLTLPTKA